MSKGYSEKKINAVPISNSNKPAGKVVFADYLNASFDKDAVGEKTINLYVSDGSPFRYVYIDVSSGVPTGTKVQLVYDDNAETSDNPDNPIFADCFTINGNISNYILVEQLTKAGHEGQVQVFDLDGTRESEVYVHIYLNGTPYITYRIDFSKSNPQPVPVNSYGSFEDMDSSDSAE